MHRAQIHKPCQVWAGILAVLPGRMKEHKVGKKKSLLAEGCANCKQAENLSFARKVQESNHVGDVQDNQAMQRLEEQQMQQGC